MKLKERLQDYKRVLTVARKPTKEEFRRSSKVSILGIIFIGAIGFIIFIGFKLTGI